MRFTWPVFSATTTLLTLACAPAGSARAQCCADCNGDGGVTVDELIRGINFSLLGGTDNDGPWGANRAIDGDPPTAWASNGGGNTGLIEFAAYGTRENDK